MGVGNYVVLPGMTYTWKVRTTTEQRAMGENDKGWSKWVSGTFRTGPPYSGTISPVGPIPGSKIGGVMPTLQWRNLSPRIFYYEVQLSKDPTFTTDPTTATAMVYWELRHGGVTNPQNSYAVPPQFPLEAGTVYYWRVRPRVQGDGIPVPWSDIWSFQTE